MKYLCSAQCVQIVCVSFTGYIVSNSRKMDKPEDNAMFILRSVLSKADYAPVRDSVSRWTGEIEKMYQNVEANNDYRVRDREEAISLFI